MQNVFQFQASKNVRVEIKNGEPWFCLKDVAEILEIRDTKSKNFNLKEGGVERIPLIDNLGRKQEATFINEPNLYRVIFRSNKAEAVKFQDWIFEEVIPQIRKTGGYQISDGLPAKTTADDRTPLRQAASALIGRKGIDYSAAYNMVHQRFGVAAIEDIPAGQLPEAVAYVHALTLHSGLVGEVLDKQPSLPAGGKILTAQDLYNLKALLIHFPYMFAYFWRTYAAVRQLNRNITAKAFDRFGDGASFARHLADSLDIPLKSWRDVEHEFF